MKKFYCICLKYMFMPLLIISSVAAIYITHTGSEFDPIREIQKMKLQNRRDDALDLVEFYFDKLRELQAGLENSGGPDDSTSADRSALAASVQRRLDWLVKSAIIQSGPDAIHLDAFV